MTTRTESDYPPGLGALEEQLRERVAALEVKSEAGEWRLAFTIDDRARDVLRLDLSTVATDIPLVIAVDFGSRAPEKNRPIELHHLGGDCSVRVECRGGGRIDNRWIDGRVSFITADMSIVRSVETVKGELVLESGDFRVAEEQEADPATFVLASGSSAHFTTRVGTVRVLGDCAIDFTDEQRRINEMIVEPDSLHIDVMKPWLYVTKLRSSKPRKTARLILGASQQGGGSLNIHATDVSDITLEGEGRIVNLSITGTANSIELAGQSTLLYLASASCDAVASCGSMASRQLHAESATVQNLLGNWTINRSIDSQLRGGSNGFRIDAAKEESHDRSQFSGSAILNFDLPHGLEGRRIITMLNQANHVEPRTSDIPGCRWHHKLPRFVLARWQPNEMARVPQDAEYVDALARLARSKGAPGAVRTRIAWCAYRLRHLSSQSRWERIALMGYRWLGYGERPGPALALWLALATVATAVALSGTVLDFSREGVDIFLNEFVRRALGPLSSLVDKDSDTNRDGNWFGYVLRPLVAIPLITAGLAIRNYVKQGR